MPDSIVLSTALKSTLSSITKSARVIDTITERLATGLKVNSALDDPQNFFSALALRHSAHDHENLLDDIDQSIRTIEQAVHGANAIEDLIDQAQSIAQDSKEQLAAGEESLQLFSEDFDISPPSISTLIQQDTPDVYYRLNETGGPIIDYGSGASGPVSASYSGGPFANAEALYTNGPAPSVEFDGINDRISIADSNMINLSTTTARTVELVFNADTTAGRQILYEEGGATNGMTIYIDNGSLYVTAEDDNGAEVYYDLNINAPITAGETYHAAFVYDGAAQTFSGYLDGQNIGTLAVTGTSFPSHSGNVAIGGLDNAGQFHDGETNAAGGYYFDGRISDVAIYNQALTENELSAHADALDTQFTTRYFHADYEKIINTINEIALDAHHNGTRLIYDDTLTTYLNIERSNYLEIEGRDMTSNGLGLENYNFNDLDDLDSIIESLREAREEVRSYAQSLSTDLVILKTRRASIESKVNIRTAGADDLAAADLNEEGANQLASQTRQTLGITALNLAAQSDQSILRLF